MENGEMRGGIAASGVICMIHNRVWFMCGVVDAKGCGELERVMECDRDPFE